MEELKQKNVDYATCLAKSEEDRWELLIQLSIGQGEKVRAKTQLEGVK